jgi:chromosome segregation ATPase
MNFEEFLAEGKENKVVEETPLAEPEELDIQKAVVEELAADKAKLDIQLDEMKQHMAELEKKLEDKAAEIATLEAKVGELKAKLLDEQERHFDEQSRNPNSLALLDRDVELPDRFPGETRDHVLEVIKEARDKAEAEGRVRCAQILESVLVANEPSGNLAQKRAALAKFFADNGNILSGPVIEELDSCGISYKKGEEFLLTSEILKRTY